MPLNICCRRNQKTLIMAVTFLILMIVGNSPSKPEEPSTLNSGNKLELRRTDTNSLFTLPKLEEVLAESSVLANLPKGQPLSFYDATFQSLTECSVFLRANSKMLVAAVLVGEIQVREKTAESGEVVTWPLGADEVEVLEFDAQRFLTSDSLRLSPQAQANLVKVAEQQERLKFWGLLEQVNFKLSSPFMPENAESVRQQYLGNPVVLHLVRHYPEVESLARAVAEVFIEALRNKDSQTIEWLISPKLFVNGDTQQASPEWTVARQDFAFLIMIDNWEIPLAEARLESTSDVSSWVVTTTTHRYHLWLEPFDGMIFVTAFEPIDEDAEGPDR